MISSQKLRQSFLNFFEKRGHKIVPSSSLIATDPTVLFTTAGMQQFKEYFLGKTSPFGKRVASCQKCFRTSDIESVGDKKHLTFLEMLGNFSFGDYFKEEAIKWAIEYLTKDLKIPFKNLWFTFFRGEDNLTKDKESKEILLDLKIPEDKVYGFGREDNFWGPTGREGPCGPTLEIHYDLTGKSCEKGKNCLPNCDCGRFIEVWSLVFNEYYQGQNGKLSPLPQKGVDTGMGLERLAMVVQKKNSVYETDLFEPIIKEIKKNSSQPYALNPRPHRIIADHIKGVVFLIAEGVLPSNVEQGYVLRRILRRAIRYGMVLNLKEDFFIPLAQKVIETYQDIYPEILSKEADILTVIQKEEEKFSKALEKGIKEFKKVSKKGYITGEEVFRLYETYSIPPEQTEELAREYGVKFSKQGFEEAFKKHQEISRAGVEKKFGGIGIEKVKSQKLKVKITKLHTATHLLHSALREILGDKVRQMGSDVSEERLRFDFSFDRKLTTEELKKVEDLVNQKIKEGLKVRKEEMSYQKAIESGALAFFKEKYPERVTVYSAGPSTGSGQVFSKEICAGPHVKKTSELGRFKIVKEESSGAGVRRIRAILE